MKVTTNNITTMRIFALRPSNLLVTLAVASSSSRSVAAFTTHASFSELVSKYDAFILDQFGVMHNGLSALDGAVDCVRELYKAGKPLIRSVQVFDEFVGSPLQEGEKSLAFRMHFQDPEKTLTDEEISQAETKIIDTVSQKFKIQVR